MKHNSPYASVYFILQSFLFAFEVIATILGCISIPRNDICSFSNSIYSTISSGFLCATIVWFLLQVKTPKLTIVFLSVSCAYHAARLIHHFLLNSYVNYVFLVLLLTGFSMALMIDRSEHVRRS
jgi:hypothetical protein